jgi:hypothetical protein
MGFLIVQAGNDWQSPATKSNLPRDLPIEDV